MRTHKSIDWDRPDWGGHVTHDSHGSWLPDAPREEL